MGIFTDLAGVAADIGNFQLQKENQEWQREMQARTWQREDNAVQRRAADMEAAGFSKTLAAGSAAASSGPINASAPQFRGDNLMKSLEYTQAKKQNAMTEAQTELARENANLAATQVYKNKLEAAVQDVMNPIRIEEAKYNRDYAKNQAEIIARENKWYKDRGLPNSLTGIAESYATGDQIAKMFGGNSSSMSPALNAITRLAGSLIPNLIPKSGSVNTTNHYLRGKR